MNDAQRKRGKKDGWEMKWWEKRRKMEQIVEEEERREDNEAKRVLKVVN